MSERIEALLGELVQAQRDQLRELRAIRRAIDATRPYMTRSQARRMLQMNDDEADALLRRIGAVKMVDGRERVFADDLLAELQARLDPVASVSPATPTAPKPRLVNERLKRVDAFAGRRRPGELKR